MPKSRTRPKAPHPVAKRVLQPLGRLLKGPYGIAAIASISFHGVVFALGPSLSDVSIAAFSDGPGGDGEQTVPLVELSAAEQGRLPDFSARRSFTGRLPIPSTTPPSFPLQRTPQRSRLSTTPQRSTGLRRTSPSLGSRQRSRSNPYLWDDRTRIARIPLPPSLAGQGLPPPRNTPEPEPEPDTTASTPTTGPDPSSENLTASTPGEAPDSGTDLDLAGLQNPSSVDAEGAASEEDPAAEPSDGAAENAESMASNEADPEQIRLRQLRDSLQWNAEGTTAAPDAVSSWVTGLSAGDDDAIVTAAAEQAIESNIRVCVENPPTDAIVGIYVQPDGTIADATLIQRTGYDTTDQAALNAAAAAAVPTEVPTAYQIDVSVDYDAESCVAPDAVLE